MTPPKSKTKTNSRRKKKTEDCIFLQRRIKKTKNTDNKTDSEKEDDLWIVWKVREVRIREVWIGYSAVSARHAAEGRDIYLLKM